MTMLDDVALAFSRADRGDERRVKDGEMANKLVD
jgi:hypothetical protein